MEAAVYVPILALWLLILYVLLLIRKLRTGICAQLGAISLLLDRTTNQEKTRGKAS